MFFILSILGLIALATVTPQLLRFRLRVFKWIHWDWAVCLLEKHFDRWVLVTRIVLLGLAVVLLLFGVASAL